MDKNYFEEEEVKDGISGEDTLGYFSPRVFLRYLYIIGHIGLLIAGSLIGIMSILIGAGITWLMDLIDGKK